MKVKIYSSLIIALLVLITGCRKEVLNFPTVETLSDQQIEIKERLQQIGDISLTVLSENQDLLNKYVKSVKNKLAKFPEEEESLTFMEILKNESFIEPGFSEIFVKKYQEKFYNNDYVDAEKYSALTQKIKSKLQGFQTSSKPSATNTITASTTLYSSVTDTIFIASLGGQLYFPYSENFAALNPLQFYTTSNPLSDTATGVIVTYHKVICRVRGDMMCDNIYIRQRVTGEWAETNPTLVANLADRPLPADPTPPPPVVTCSDLTANTIPTLDDRYFISNSIPKIRLIENIRYGFWSGSNRIQMWQAYDKLINPTVGSTSGTLAITAPNRPVGTARITRKEARKGTWKDFGPIWNPDWKMEQKDNYMVIVYQKSWLSGTNLTVDYNVKAGLEYNATTQTWVPSFTGTVTGSGSMSIGKNFGKYGEDWIPRSSILTNAVGDFFGLGTTVTQNIYLPTPFTIRAVNKFQYYFKTNVCY